MQSLKKQLRIEHKKNAFFQAWILDVQACCSVGFPYYVGKLVGAVPFFDGTRSRFGVAATEPGKWYIVANSSVFKTKVGDLNGG